MITSTMQCITLLLLIILTTQHFIIPSFSLKCNPDDKNALLQIKKQLGNPTNLSSWKPTTNCCMKWKGVECGTEPQPNRVGGLILQDIELLKPFPFPTSVTNLPFLDTLALLHIPNLVGTIPPSISNLTKLEVIFITHTRISGEIPNILSQMKTLLAIEVSYSNLTGPLPTTLSSLPNLFGLYFDGNHLTGAIPESYGSFSKSSTSLGLRQNRFSGKIPASLAKLTNLEFVDFSSNALEGDASMLFGSNKKTKHILLGMNFLAFDIGKVRMPKNLNELDLRNNRIYGTLPKGLKKLKLLSKFNVSNNNMCGQIPQGGKMFDESCYSDNKCLCASPLHLARFNLVGSFLSKTDVGSLVLI